MKPPVKKSGVTKRTIIASVSILLLIPLTISAGIFLFDNQHYNIVALLVLLECMLPFILMFEGRKPKARELVTIAVLCAIGIAGRSLFFMLPQFKPVLALAIIAGVAFGGETGFFVGAVTMLLSNMLFSQGPWTPWQMFAMGIIGFLAGFLHKKGLLPRSRLSLAIFGAISTVLIFGGIMNPASLFIFSPQSVNLKTLLTHYLTGLPMDTVHAFSTVVFITLAAKPMLEKLDRIKVKYGLVEPL
jgi:energy-coupling factor transport system ATP-binding protein